MKTSSFPSESYSLFPEKNDPACNGMREAVIILSPLPYGRITYIRFQGSGFRPLSHPAPPASLFRRNAVIISLLRLMSTIWKSFLPIISSCFFTVSPLDAVRWTIYDFPCDEGDPVSRSFPCTESRRPVRGGQVILPNYPPELQSQPPQGEVGTPGAPVTA